jgi:hypothetical protein
MGFATDTYVIEGELVGGVTLKKACLADHAITHNNTLD